MPQRDTHSWWWRWTRSGLSNVSYAVSYLMGSRHRTILYRERSSNHPRRSASAATGVIYPLEPVILTVRVKEPVKAALILISSTHVNVLILNFAFI